jgi:hypothetical protein
MIQQIARLFISLIQACYGSLLVNEERKIAVTKLPTGYWEMATIYLGFDGFQ